MSMIKYNSSGFLVKAVDRNAYKTYCGVEGNTWCMRLKTEIGNFSELNSYYYNKIERNWRNIDFVDLCTNIGYIKRYIMACKEANFDTQLLYCMTTKRYPENNIQPITNYNSLFLGYDYAYAGGTFYSCVFSDVYMNRIEEFSNIQLNDNGLISSEKDMLRFIKVREGLQENKDLRIERGDFTIYKLWSINF